MQRLREKKGGKLGCLATVILLVLIILATDFYRERRQDKHQQEGHDMIPWYQAAELCKEKYKSLPQYRGAKIPNARKRTETDTEYVFFWDTTLGLTMKDRKGRDIKYQGICRVSRSSGRIVYLSLGNQVLIE